MKTKLFLLVLTICILNSIVYVNAQVKVYELTFHKTFLKGKTETIKKFSVSANFNVLEIEAFGNISSGKLIITLLTPKGNTFETYEFDDQADVKYKQVFDLQKNPAEYTGDWQIKINIDSNSISPGAYEFHITLN